MAHATEERKQNQQGNQPQSKPGQPTQSPQNQGKEGTAFEYQKDKPITGEQHGSGNSDSNRGSNQPQQPAQHQGAPVGAKH